MKIKQARFLISSPTLKLCPQSNLCEFALLGRSNVGKSTFINTLANNQKLAKTSNTPGKTRLINLFEMTLDKEKKFMIADLPGYGYAKVSKKEQENWQKNLEEYLLKRENLVSTIQFIDARHEIQKNDFQMHEWLLLHGIASFVILTKTDYVSKNELPSRIASVKKYFRCDVLPFSSKNKIYIENTLGFLSDYIK